MQWEPSDWIAQTIRDAIASENITGLEASNVWSDVSPDRTWCGKATCEIGHDTPVLVPAIDGNEIFDTPVSINVKGNTKAEAINVMARVASWVEYCLGTLAETDPNVFDYLFAGGDYFPDIEGTTIQSEYWVIRRYTITHK